MPLEISEIGVRLTVAGPGSIVPSGTPDERQGAGPTPEQEERIVAAAVAEVLRILRMREER